GQRIDDVADPAGNRGHVVLLETTRGAGRCTNAQAAGDERRTRVVGHGVLVGGDVGPAQRFFRGFAGDAFVDQADQDEVVVGAAGDDVEAAVHEYVGHGAGVFDGLFLVGFELITQGFFEGDGLG